jgi:hypothetical protein
LAISIWIAALPLISKNFDDSIINYDDRQSSTLDTANLYFSTWISLIISILLVTNWFQCSISTSDWVLLATASFALMASAISFVRGSSEIETEEGIIENVPVCSNYLDILATSCKKSTLGFYMGLFFGVVSMIMIPLNQRAGPLCNVVIGAPMIIVWGYT